MDSVSPSPFARSEAGSDDAQLIAALRGCARRDLEALREVCALTLSDLMAQLLQIVGDAEEATAMLPELGERIWREAATYLPAQCPPRLWLRGLARREAIDRLRARAVALSEEERHTLLIQVETEEAHASAMPATSSFSGIDPVLRYSLRLAYLSGFPSAELARTLDLPEAAVRARLHAALGQLAAAAEGEDPPTMLAGAYVLGIQSRRVRLRYARRLHRWPPLRRQCQWWEKQLAPLGADPLPARPDEDPWPKIEARVTDGRGPARPAPSRRWLWISALLAAAAVAMLVSWPKV